MRGVLVLALVAATAAADAKPPAVGAKPPAAGAKPPAAGAKPPAAGAKPPAAGAKPPAAARKAPGPAPTGVHAVDWRNFTYPGTGCDRCQGSGPIRIVNGRSVPDPILTALEAWLVRVTYFDATGSEEDEALVEVFWRFSPKGYTRRWYLYAHEGRRLEVLWLGSSLSYEDELGGVVKVTPGRRGFVTEEVDAAGKRTQVTYAGAIEGKVHPTRRPRAGRR